MLWLENVYLKQKHLIALKKFYCQRSDMEYTKIIFKIKKKLNLITVFSHAYDKVIKKQRVKLYNKMQIKKKK